MTSHSHTNSTDGAITAAVRALAAGRGLTHARIAHGIELATATFTRRLTHGGWTANELVKLAGYFKVDVETLITGLDGKVAPPAS